MPDGRIDELIESLRSIESTQAGRDALTAPHRGDYDWGNEQADTECAMTTKCDP